MILKLVEELSGLGVLVPATGDRPSGPVRYRLQRYQGVMEGSGLPIPGVHKIEGQIDAGDPAREPAGPGLDALIGRSMRLQLDDGRSLPVTVVDATGRVLTEGHGPTKCLCC